VSGPDDRDKRAAARFAATRHEGGDWSAPSPQDAADMGEVAGLWRDLDGVADNPAVLAMRQQALARLEASAPRARRWPWPVLAGVAASLAVVVAHRPAPPAAPVSAGQVIANGQNFPREVALADGTRVTLDSRTQMHVSGGGRQVRLDYGRAFFNVRHDAAHPFAVQVADMTVQDIGTRFEVRQEQGTTSVTLVEGKVRALRGGHAMDMAPGGRLTLRGGQWALETLDAAHQTAWQSGMISADDRPVGEVVAQFNRYRSRPLIIRDRAAQAVRVSGEFRLDDPQGFVEALSAMGVVVTS
jgi:transmembrane sensor